MTKIEIDIKQKDGGKFYLDVDGERVLVSDKLGEVMDKVERETKKIFNIKEGKIRGFFGR